MKHYRYQANVQYDEYAPPSVKIQLLEFESVKETNGGYWIVKKADVKYYNLIPMRSFVKPVFVLKKSRKRYAYPTKEEAFNSFKIRNRKRIAYLNRDLNNAKIISQRIIEIDNQQPTLKNK